jgi:hypothetical protein
MSQLLREIQSSPIVTSVSGINGSDTEIQINFNASLSDTDKSILDEIVAAHVAYPDPNIQDVRITEDTAFTRDPYTKKLITKDEPYNGPLYQVACRFTTGKGSNDPSWKPPVDKPNLWSIDVSNPGYTYVDFLPNFSIQVDGCGYRLLQESPVNEVVMEAIMLAPNIPSQYGGSYVFASNFQIIGDYDKFERFTAPKFLKYNPQIPEASRIRFKIKHDVSEHVKLCVYLSTYIIS